MRTRHTLFGTRRTSVIYSLLIAAIIVAWLAPITLFGRMPIGGDVTSFFMPLMAYYREAITTGRVPLWNELWGYGFPMLAESQAGVFYPPHLVLYWLFEVETAYTLNIVLHHLLAGWFAYLGGRIFGLRSAGAALAALVFAGNGFFIIHFPHQWSYTAGCWLPLALGLAWRVAGPASADREVSDAGEVAAGTEAAWKGRVRAALGLAAVLAVQMLAGHFQVAFYTQVMVLLIGLVCTMQYLISAFRSRTGRYRAVRKKIGTTSTTSAAPAARAWGNPFGVFWVIVPVAAAFTLAAVQLFPTFELIRLALPRGRDFEYLSGFANTPFHLVSYFYPTLFHVNPLWRPVAWDPFHTSPEECFSYVGLLPLCLAVGAGWRWRREPRVRMWVLLLVLTLLFSLGPYVPWFRALIQLPGFDGFRSASRWSIATGLCLALLAGRAFDGLRSTARLWSWLRRMVFAMVLVGMGAGGFTWVLVRGSTWPLQPGESTKLLDLVSRAWSYVSPFDDREALWVAATRAHEPPRNPLAIPGLASLGYRIKPQTGEAAIPGPRGLRVRRLTLAGEFVNVMIQELLPPVILFVIILAAFYFAGRRISFWLVIALVALDLGAAAWLRPVLYTKRRDLADESSVLSYLARHARGERVQDSHQNLAMLAGAAPVNSYRTVDIEFSTAHLNPDPALDPRASYKRVSNRTDTRWEIWNAGAAQMAGLPPSPEEHDEAMVDMVLAEILYGRKLVQAYGHSAAAFVVRKRETQATSRVWFWDETVEQNRLASLLEQSGGKGKPADLTYHWLFSPPLTSVPSVRVGPERHEIALKADHPGVLVVSDLAYPGWEAEVVRADGRAGAATTIVGEAGCLLVRIPQAGEQLVKLRFRSRAFERGVWVSVAAAGVWLIVGMIWLRK